MRAVYLSHPQVEINPAVPVPLWGLSQDGRARAEAFVAQAGIPEGTTVFSSGETKAIELADLIAAAAGTRVIVNHEMGENDRSATGFLPPLLFEEMADQFFAHPEESVRGWERAVDAQARIVANVGVALECAAEGVPVIFCGHGGVGTLLKCHLAKRPIARSQDQGNFGHRGGGNAFLFDTAGTKLLSEWTPMEQVGPDWFK